MTKGTEGANDLPNNHRDFGEFSLSQKFRRVIRDDLPIYDREPSVVQGPNAGHSQK